jgi:hypothetical protein
MSGVTKAKFDREITVESADIPPPPLKLIASVLEAALNTNYEEASVEIVDCPDLTKAPFNLAAKGLCGKSSLADVGWGRKF